MQRFRIGTMEIASVGYDAQCAMLEVEFAADGQVMQYIGVPEDLWYRFRKEVSVDVYFHRYIKGCYREKLLYIKRRKN